MGTHANTGVLSPSALGSPIPVGYEGKTRKERNLLIFQKKKSNINLSTTILMKMSHRELSFDKNG